MTAPASRPVALLIENESMILIEVADALAAARYDVHEAGDAEDAMRLLDTIGSVQLLFTDVNLPGEMDGFGIAREVRQRWPDASVILCSGSLPKISEMPSGAQFIEKPFTAEALSEAITAIGPH